MTVRDSLALAAAALRGDRSALPPLADAMEEAGMRDDAARLRALAAQEKPSTAGGLALAALRCHPLTGVRLESSGRWDDMPQPPAEAAADTVFRLPPGLPAPPGERFLENREGHRERWMDSLPPAFRRLPGEGGIVVLRIS